MSRSIAAVAAALTFGGVAVAQQPPAEEHVRGDVASVSGDSVEVKTRSGETAKFSLTDKTKVSVATKADLGRIDKNAYIGTTAVPQPDGSLRAVEIHIFAEPMRGSGEGHRPWDLQAGSTMTNATVSGMDKSGGSQSTMTNATVKDVAKGGGGMKLALRYKDGEKTVVVPAGIPVVQLEPADRSRLTPGAHVFAAVKRGEDGARVADRIFVGKDVVPPM
ncbi:MAG TPA: hypothetical protein VFK85_00650 [Anaeromyxobacteraceae bacterium]|nr:hypothetical protein [Anaeromyxobacteraceae bacterium]